MVIIVAAALAFAADALKNPINKNREIEKKMNILMSVGKALEISGEKNLFIESEYKKYIKEEFLVNAKGERIQGDAFNTDLKKEYAKPEQERKLPVFVCIDKDIKLYILPVRGKGLWGAIWGYVSLKDDLNTIYGTNFDHASETPGLGAQIATRNFQERFSGKKLFKNSAFVSVQVIKEGSAALDDYKVDGISGSTITSKAVGKMMLESLSNYRAFFGKFSNQ
jgi:Na+-transporting NADH:ubiquinone oxidoreductase subunit C